MKVKKGSLLILLLILLCFSNVAKSVEMEKVGLTFGFTGNNYFSMAEKDIKVEGIINVGKGEKVNFNLYGTDVTVDLTGLDGANEPIVYEDYVYLALPDNDLNNALIKIKVKIKYLGYDEVVISVPGVGDYKKYDTKFSVSGKILVKHSGLPLEGTGNVGTSLDRLYTCEEFSNPTNETEKTYSTAVTGNGYTYQDLDSLKIAVTGYQGGNPFISNETVDFIVSSGTQRTNKPSLVIEDTSDLVLGVGLAGDTLDKNSYSYSAATAEVRGASDNFVVAWITEVGNNQETPLDKIRVYLDGNTTKDNMEVTLTGEGNNHWKGVSDGYGAGFSSVILDGGTYNAAANDTSYSTNTGVYTINGVCPIGNNQTPGSYKGSFQVNFKYEE